MKGTRAAQRYAKAILSLAKDKGAAEAVNNDMEDIVATISKSEDLDDMLGSPVVSSSIKSKVLLEVFKNTHAITKGSFNILIENNRINILDLVAKQYIVKYRDMNYTREAVVTSAVPLTADLEKKILAKVKELTGAEARIKNIVDEELIGGFVLRIGDLQYDASIAHSFDTLKREFKNNTYVSKI